MAKAPIIVGLMVLVVLAILGVGRSGYLKEIRLAKEKLLSYETQMANTSVGPLEYLRANPGQGAPILISHGITGGFDQGLGLASEYIGQGYDLIAVSRFGYLGSPLPEDSSPKAQAEAYKSLLDEIGLEKAFVFGNSAGATSAISFALNYPERCLGLILVSANVPTEGVVALPPKQILKFLFGNNLAYWLSMKIAGHNMLSAAGIPKEILRHLDKEKKDELLAGIMGGALPINLRTAGIINDFFVSNPDINSNAYRFEDIEVPVIMVHAKDDTLCNYTEAVAVAERIPDISFVSFDDGGHIILGHDKEVQKEIGIFVETLNL